MSVINDVMSQTLKGSDAGASSRTQKKDMGQEEFMKLMVAQMNFQNPLEPQSNAEFLSQMAQFGTVEGISKVQESIDAMQQSFQSNQTLQATSLVGRHMVVSSNQIEPVENGMANGTIDLTESARNIKISFYSEEGALVRQLDCGAHASGSVDFAWDGRDSNGMTVPPGKYKMMAEGDTSKGHSSFATNRAALIDSVSIDKNGSGIALNVEGMGSVPFGSVTRIK